MLTTDIFLTHDMRLKYFEMIKYHEPNIVREICKKIQLNYIVIQYNSKSNVYIENIFYTNGLTTKDLPCF